MGEVEGGSTTAPGPACPKSYSSLMGRQIEVRVAALVPFGRVHINDSSAALRGRTEYTWLRLDADRPVDRDMLRLIYCTIANLTDPSIAAQRVPSAIKAFSSWWHEGATYIQDEQRTWGAIGVRNGDLLVLLTEPPDEETKNLIDMVVKQTAMIDADAEKKALAEAISEGVQAAVGPHTRARSKPVPGQVFIAMPMNENAQPELADTHDTLKAVCGELGLSAKRVDDVQTNNRITDTIRDLIDASEFVIADLSDNRPNVYFEAGYAEGVGKTPVYIAKVGTDVQFDVKDYPVIFYQNQRSLRDGVTVRLRSLVETRSSSPSATGRGR